MLPEATARSYASLTPVQPAVGKTQMYWVNITNHIILDEVKIITAYLFC